MFVKIPPQAIDVEMAVLGSIIINQKILIDVYEMFSEDIFYSTAHRNIAQSIIKLYTKQITIDIITLCEEMRRNETLDISGSEAYLSELTEMATIANIQPHIEILKSKSKLRNVIGECCRIIETAYAPESLGTEIVDHAIMSLGKMVDIDESKEYNHQQSVYDYMIYLEESKKTGRIIKGESSFLPDLDNIISGWETGKCYLISGLEKLGKSRFVRALASHWLKKNFGVCFFMLEEDATAIHECLLANRTLVNTEVFGTSEIEGRELNKVLSAANNYMGEPMYISTKSKITPMQVKVIIQRQKIKMKKAGSELKFCIIDYIQRMEGEGEGHAKMEYIASELANIARDENICMIEISQMSSSAEKNKSIPLHTQLRFGKVFKEAAKCIITFDDPGRNKTEESNDDGFCEPQSDYKILLAHIIQRGGVSYITIPIRAQLQFSTFHDTIK